MDDNIYIVMEYLLGDDSGFPVGAYYSRNKAESKAIAWEASYKDNKYTVIAVPLGG